MEGLNMILTGKSVNGVKAWKLHLADAIVLQSLSNEKSNEL